MVSLFCCRGLHRKMNFDDGTLASEVIFLFKLAKYINEEFLELNNTNFLLLSLKKLFDSWQKMVALLYFINLFHGRFLLFIEVSFNLFKVDKTISSFGSRFLRVARRTLKYHRGFGAQLLRLGCMFVRAFVIL